jgi:hypothetical protein
VLQLASSYWDCVQHVHNDGERQDALGASSTDDFCGMNAAKNRQREATHQVSSCGQCELL